MTVLNTIELTEQSWMPFVISGSLILSLFITVPLLNKVKNNYVGGMLGIYSLVALATGVVILLACDEFQVPSGEYHYEIAIDNETSFAEVIEKYNIIEQRGEIFVVEERENE